jgi:hypothetical protein
MAAAEPAPKLHLLVCLQIAENDHRCRRGKDISIQRMIERRAAHPPFRCSCLAGGEQGFNE